MIKDGYGKLVVAHIVAASTAGFIYAAAVHRRRKSTKSLEVDNVVVVPKLEFTGSGHAGRLEKFHHYVVKTGPSVTEAAWGKMNLTAKAITEGGYESMFRQIFAPSDPNEKLKKTFACYLSTATGPVAGTIYLSTARVAFCSDRPLCFTAPSGQETWSYYKVVIPLGNIGTVNPVTMRENPSERYIQIVTVDGHDFWFMGFVNYDKASKHLMNSVSEFNAKVAASSDVHVA